PISHSAQLTEGTVFPPPTGRSYNLGGHEREMFKHGTVADLNKRLTLREQTELRMLRSYRTGLDNIAALIESDRKRDPTLRLSASSQQQIQELFEELLSAGF